MTGKPDEDAATEQDPGLRARFVSIGSGPAPSDRDIRRAIERLEQRLGRKLHIPVATRRAKR